MNSATELATAGPRAKTNSREEWLQLQPCRVQKQKHLVHHPVLALHLSDICRAICRWSRYHHHWQLLANRRLSPCPPRRNRRRPWLPCLVFSAVCFTEPAAGGEMGPESQLLQAMTTEVHPAESNETRLDQGAGQSTRSTLPINVQWRHEISTILRDHWHRTPQDPNTLDQEIDAMADYFSAFSDVRELLQALHGKSWRLQFAERTFGTRVKGSRLSVDSVTVSFDPYAAAQYKFQSACKNKPAFCVAVPADVLLHELLHTRQALLAPAEFIRDGGFSQNMYPHQHEQRIITRENMLYAAMSKVDHQPRPLRQEHSGRALPVACATCFY